jgi:chaperone modulatory protein CbpM
MMTDDEILNGQLEDGWCSLEEFALACRLEPAWLQRCLDEELLPGLKTGEDKWQFSATSLMRARRIYRLERDFDANLELAALVADMLEELDQLRARLALLDRLDRSFP